MGLNQLLNRVKFDSKEVLQLIAASPLEKLLSKITFDADWNEADHPRGPDGKFAKMSGAKTEVESTTHTTTSKTPEKHGKNVFKKALSFVTKDLPGGGKEYEVVHSYYSTAQASEVLEKVKKIYAEAGAEVKQDKWKLIASLKVPPKGELSGKEKEEVKKLPEVVKEVEKKSVAGGLAKDISSWKKIGESKGGNPGGVYEDNNGVKHYVKFPQTNPEQAQAEKLSDSIYSALGMNAKESKLVEKDGKLGLSSKLIPLKPMTKEEMASSDMVRGGFVADAFLGNWDVFGQDYDNIAKSQWGEAVRVDNGGTLFFRAQGSPKDFSSTEVPELESLIESGRQGKEIYGKLTEKEIRQQAKDLVETLYDSKIENLVANAGFEGETAKKYVDTLKGRRDYIQEKILNKLPSLPKIPLDDYLSGKLSSEEKIKIWEQGEEFHTSLKELQDGKVPLSGPEKTSISAYTGHQYEDINRCLRSVKGCRKSDVDNIKAAIGRSKIPDPIVAYRGTNLPKDILEKLKVGATYSDPGVLSVATSPKVAEYFIDFSNNSAEDVPVIFQLDIPAGANARAVGSSETELIFSPSQKWRVDKIEDISGHNAKKVIHVRYEE